MNPYRKNIYLILGLFGLRALVIWWNVIQVLYFRSFDLSFLQISTIVIAHSLTVFALEVPSGVFSDRYGRKKTLVIFSVLLLMATLIFAFGSTYLAFLIASLIAGASTAFWSGTNSSLLYESLKKVKKKKLFRKYISRANFFYVVVGVVTNFVVPIIFLKDARLPLEIAVIFAIITVLTTLALKDTVVAKKNTSRLIHFKKILQKPAIRWVILFSALFWITSSSFGQLLNQPLVAEYFSLKQYGLIFSLATIIQSVLVYHSEKILDFFGKYSFAFTALLWSVATFSLHFVSMFWFIFIFGIMWTLSVFKVVLVENAVQHIVHSDSVRATVMSTESFARYIVEFISFPLIGLFMDVFTMMQTVYLIAALAFLFSVVLLFKPKEVR